VVAITSTEDRSCAIAAAFHGELGGFKRRRPRVDDGEKTIFRWTWLQGSIAEVRFKLRESLGENVLFILSEAVRGNLLRAARRRGPACSSEGGCCARDVVAKGALYDWPFSR